MAIDETVMMRQTEDALLYFFASTALRKNKTLPTLRFYSWTRPAFSFGYFQKIAEEVNVPQCREHGIELVRRPTGGGTVIHGWDVTYSIAVSLSNSLIPKDTLESYYVISQCIITGLRQLDIVAEHYSDRLRNNASAQNLCLTNPTKYDILIAGKKVAGAAQRRKQGVMLHQGYIAFDMPPEQVTNLVSKQTRMSQFVSAESIAIKTEISKNVTKKEVVDAIVSGFETTLNIKLTSEPLSPSEIAMANHLAQTKYATDKWNFR